VGGEARARGHAGGVAREAAAGGAAWRGVSWPGRGRRAAGPARRAAARAEQRRGGAEAAGDLAFSGEATRKKAASGRRVWSPENGLALSEAV
jgi:hypothetical protein